MGNPLLVSVDSDTNLFPNQVRKANELTVRVDLYGAKGDGATDDTAAIQAAFSAVTTAGGGIVQFSRRTYKITNMIIVGSNTIVDGNGAVISMLVGSSKVSFANQSAANATGYGTGGRNIHFRDLTWKGDYATVQGDLGTGWNHVENLSFTNCVFEQGMANGHWIDLGGCKNVRITGCTFLGMNPVANRAYVEAIQVDVNTMQASSNKNEPASAFDGLPTRDVYVSGCYFGGITVAGTTYPAPNPIGSHTVALDSDAGYYENIHFVDNTVRGTYVPATQAVSGWCHFYGARAVNVTGNTFVWTGASGTSGNPQVVSFTRATAGVPASDVGIASPSTVTFATPRPCTDITVSSNRFIGFAAAPVQTDTGLVNLDYATNATVVGNTCNGASTSFVRATNGYVTVASNMITTNTTEPAVSFNTCSYSHIKDNQIALAANGVGVKIVGGTTPQASGNVISAGATSIIVDAGNNAVVQNNTLINFTSVGISVSPTTASTDTLVSSNRAGSGTGTATCLLIGATSTRARRFGNIFRGPGTVTDNGTGTTTVATDQTT